MYFSGRHHYEKALRTRRLIYNDFQSVFVGPSSSDPLANVILTPVTLGSAPRQSQMREMGPVQSSVYDSYIAPVNLAGMCTSVYKKTPFNMKALL